MNSFRFSFRSTTQPQNAGTNGKLSTLDEDTEVAFPEEKGSPPQENDATTSSSNGNSSLNQSKHGNKEILQINNLTSRMSITSGVGVELTLAPPPAKKKEIDARKIFAREKQKSSMAVFAAPKFDDDMRRLFATTKYASTRSLLASDVNDNNTTAEDDAEASSSNKVVVAKKQKLTFIDVTIREYPNVVGVNPAVSCGTPVTIGWELVSSVDLDIDKYEEARAGHRRNHQKMKMNKDRRQKILKELGFSLAERQKGAKEATIVRNRRKRVNAALDSDATHEQMEKVKRRLQSIVTLNHRKRKEKAYLRRSISFFETQYGSNNREAEHLSRSSASSRTKKSSFRKGRSSTVSLSSTCSAPAALQ